MVLNISCLRFREEAIHTKINDLGRSRLFFLGKPWAPSTMRKTTDQLLPRSSSQIKAVEQGAGAAVQLDSRRGPFWTVCVEFMSIP